MSVFRIYKYAGDHVTFGSERLFAWSTYDVHVFAREFASDTSSVATLNLLHDSGGIRNVVFATCELTPDPLRRGVRTGTLAIGDETRAALFDMLVTGGESVEPFVVHVTKGSDNSTVVHREIPLVLTPRVVQTGGGGGGGATSASLWTVVDGGAVVAPCSIPVGDRTQVSITVTGSGTVDILPRVAGVPVTGGPFEAYVRIMTEGSWAPLTEVTVAGSPVVWDYRDSSLLSSPSWLLHLMSIGGVWRASLKSDASVPGVEEDSDGDAVPGTEVNE